MNNAARVRKTFLFTSTTFEDLESTTFKREPIAKNYFSRDVLRQFGRPAYQPRIRI